MAPPQPFFDLLNALSSQNFNKFERLEVISVAYKTLESTENAISTDILIPKKVLRREAKLKCPVLIRIHGGFLVTGSSLYAPWFSNWILDYAIQSQAVIISPNYRLLPEATGENILEDMRDLWSWLHQGKLTECLVEAGFSQVTADISRILLLGESAGGYLATQLALSYPEKVKGVIAAYPMLDLRSRFYTEVYDKPIIEVPNLPVDLVNNHLAAIEKGATPTHVTAADPPCRLKLAFSIVQNARFLEFFGKDNSELFPMERLQNMQPELLSKLPPFFIFHGEQDSAVPSEGSRRFISLLREKAPTSKSYLHIQDGDHGFDSNATINTPWLRNGLIMISKAWLQQSSRL